LNNTYIMENNNISEPDNKKCLICWDNITCNTWAKCHICDILLHDKCETIYRTINNRKYCQCPHCQEVGTLGRMYQR
jgi:hypothetical protein